MGRKIKENKERHQITVSLDKDLFEDLNNLVKKKKIYTRSELVADGIKMLLEDEKPNDVDVLFSAMNSQKNKTDKLSNNVEMLSEIMLFYIRIILGYQKSFSTREEIDQYRANCDKKMESFFSAFKKRLGSGNLLLDEVFKQEIENINNSC